MRPVIIDTSLWVNWFRGQETSAREGGRGRVLYMPAVVALELFSGAKDRRSYRMIDGLTETFSRNKRLIIPTYEDYKLAGNTLADLGWAAGRKANDALIASCARRIGAEVWTSDASDFSVLSKALRFPIVSQFD